MINGNNGTHTKKRRRKVTLKFEPKELWFGIAIDIWSRKYKSVYIGIPMLQLRYVAYRRLRLNEGMH